MIDDERIEKWYKYIKYKNSRVDDNDKQWIAYSSQEHERETAIKAIKKYWMIIQLDIHQIA
ncbi:hypothetical protein [Aliarcobacter butzleri]|uniref:hypothetical protein n=1 Tax=Aliarcobacter butzleri TaxID=28197 RepID=UPI0021B4484D|nr:hypothetical protein [Aliarcobacter butzleri]MCT7614908.1 hypothetical protein [Aliarcobacter butzleri]